MPTIDKRGLINDGTQDLNIAGNLTVNGAVTSPSIVPVSSGSLLGDVSVWNGTNWVPFTYSTVSSWYIDPANSSGTASDSNNGTSAVTPLLTFGALLKRVALPGAQWYVNQNVTINVMSDQAYDAEFIHLNVVVRSGCQLLIQSYVTGGTNNLRNVTAASTFTSSSAINRTAAQLYGATDSVNTAFLATANANLLLWDATTSRYAWIYDQPGAVGTVRTSSPMAALTNPASAPAPAPSITAFGSTDSYRVLAPVKINIVDVMMDTDFQEPNWPGQVMFVGLWFQNSTAYAGDTMVIRTNTTFTNSRIIAERCRFDISLQAWGCVDLTNCNINALYTRLPNVRVIGGIATRAVQLFEILDGWATLDGDAIFGGAMQIMGRGIFGYVCAIGASVNAGISSPFYPNGSVSIGTILYGGAQLWGTAAVTVNRGSFIINSTGGAFASTITCAASFTLGGQSIGVSYNRITGAITGNLATTWANVDAQTPKHLVDPCTGATVCT
jgi:hypothetical protein